MLDFIAAFVVGHSWLVPVIAILLGISEALPHFPNIESNNVIQLIVNGLKALKEKLSLTDKTPPAAE